jgi:XTP/dITP diphosphohydrolase
MRLVLASANPDKAREMADILGAAFTLEPRPGSVPEVIEDGDTLEANARLKAAAICAATGQAAVADDTGFEVDALGGAPGVYAARFAGEHATYADNVAKVLAELRRVGADEPRQRRARFHTVALVCRPDGSEVVGRGTVEGIVALAPMSPAADVRPFGYDPIFVPDDGDGRSFAQMAPAEKHAISHRGRAFRALAEQLEMP